MPTLLVCLNTPTSAEGELGFAQLADDGVGLLAQGSAPLALLPAGTDVTLLLGAAALSWHQLSLPQGSLANSTRLRAVLDGLLEDRLLEEPARMHFALQPDASAGAPVWVAACARAPLVAAVQAFEAAGRRVTRIVPEFAPQPADAPPRLTAIGTAQAPRLAVCDANGVAVLPLDAQGLALAGHPPLDTAVLGTEPAVAAQADDVLGRRVPIVQASERWLQATRGGWDLAQFELASTGRARAGKQAAQIWQELRHAPRWRAARWGLVVLVLAQLIGVNAWALQERRALAAKRARIDRILTSTFPSVKLVVDAPAQMAREVAALQQASGGVSADDLEPMLSAIGASLSPGHVPSAIDYAGSQLRLRGLGLAQADLEPLRQTLAARGYSVRSEADLLLVQAQTTEVAK